MCASRVREYANRLNALHYAHSEPKVFYAYGIIGVAMAAHGYTTVIEHNENHNNNNSDRCALFFV